VSSEPSGASPPADAAAKRAKGVKRAILSSLPTKFANIIVQLVLLPIYATAIGTERFGAYTNIVALLGFIGMANLALGPATALRLARNVDGDQDADRVTVSSTVAIFLVSALAEVLLLVGVLAVLPPETWLDKKFAPIMPEAVIAFWLVLGLNVLQRVGTVVEFVRLGRQEQSINNLAMGGATLLMIVGLLVGRVLFPSLWLLPLIITGPIVLAAFANGFFLLRHHRYLVPRRAAVQKPAVLEVLRINLASAVMYVADYLTLPAFILIFTPVSTVQAVSAVGVLMNIHRLALGVMATVTTPAYPALAQAVAAGDSDWANRAFGKIRLFAIVYGAVFLLGMATVGPWVIEKLYSPDFRPTGMQALAFGLFFAATTIEHGYYWYLVAFAREWLSSLLMLARGVVCVAACWVICRIWPGDPIAFGLSIGLAATTLWAMPVTAWRLGRNLRATSQPESV